MSYSQEICDAVRSRISGGDVGQAVRDVARDAFDISWALDSIKNEFITAASEMQRPSVLFKPDLTQDGDAWLAIYGDLPTGVVGAGSTPAEAMADFDRVWFRGTRGVSPTE